MLFVNYRSLTYYSVINIVKGLFKTLHQKYVTITCTYLELKIISTNTPFNQLPVVTLEIQYHL